MTLNKAINFLFFGLFLLLLNSCSGGFGNEEKSPDPINKELQKYLLSTGPNVIKVSISGSLCSSYKYLNQPCVEVTICEIDSNNCQTIDNILLDTGSYGLRIFKSKINVNLTDIVETGTGKQYGACATFGSGASWGSVASADVILGDLSLGGVKAKKVPIQVIDSSFQNSSQNCNDGEVDTTPAIAMFNGILGVGLLAQDCGAQCVTNPNKGIYFSCSGNSCTKSTIPLAKQIANPVQKLESDNNGYVIAFPGVGSLGSPSVDGVMILGIGTRANNIPDPAISVVSLNNNFAYGSVYYKNNTSGKAVTGSSGIIDSGTNGWAFPDPTITNCPSPSEAFYCPVAEVSSTVLLSGVNSVSISNNFSIANAYTLPAANDVYNNIGFELPAINHVFILGIPHMLNKAIFFGIEGGESTLNQGFGATQKLFWAY